MSALSIIGTAAMFLVGGGILVHGLPIVAEGLHIVEAWANSLPTAGGLVGVIGSMLYNGLFGLVAGGVIVGVFFGVKRLLPGRAAAQ